MPSPVSSMVITVLLFNFIDIYMNATLLCIFNGIIYQIVKHIEKQFAVAFYNNFIDGIILSNM
jgi:hypothetical protein